MLRVFNRRNRILLLELTKTDFKLRYQGSVLGYLWAILRPMLMFGILYLVFAKFLRFGAEIPHYPVYLMTGTVIWNFFTECTGQGIQSLIIRSDLMRKISFPKWIIVLSATTTALINLAINLVVVVIFALVSGVSVSWTWLLVPLLIFEFISALVRAFPVFRIAQRAVPGRIKYLGSFDAGAVLCDSGDLSSFDGGFILAACRENFNDEPDRTGFARYPVVSRNFRHGDFVEFDGFSFRRLCADFDCGFSFGCWRTYVPEKIEIFCGGDLDEKEFEASSGFGKQT